VSHEQLPDPLADFLVDRDDSRSAGSSLVPTAPQFSSRRELRNAARAVPSAASRARSAKVATSKLSRRDEALARKLAVQPRTVPVASTPARKTTKQHPLKVLFVLIVISGFVCGIALPAAAFAGNTAGEAQSLTATTVKRGQSIKVNASIEASTVSRDPISATSVAELRAEQVSARTLASLSAVRQPGDDYPWRSAGYSLSPLGYYYRQCVDFVAWRLNRDAGVTQAPWKWTWSTLTPNGGDASQWQRAWIAHGWETSAVPVVGSVAWFVGDHVAYVKAIEGDNVVIEEYNGEASRAYAERTIPIASVGRFLYPPPN
jgi:surface antigen